jgi:glyoxylase-like metal-dependent hydrolase (beta-lactamase superfamily II)
MISTSDGNGLAPGDPVRYPLSEEPQVGDGSGIEVAPGVFWLRMPLPSPLSWINVWALRDEGGWTIVDTGLWSAETIKAWALAFSKILEDGPVKRVIATHMHPDHCGLAGWFTERFGVRLWMSRLEYLTCRVVSSETGEAPAEGVAFFRAAGWDEESLHHYRNRFGSFGKQIYPLPVTYRRVVNEERISVGEFEWTVVVGNGHSPEHACLFCADRKLLISGDQVLPRISSNVSVYPTEPEANPLLDWISSLSRLKSRIPEDVLVLPAHKSPFLGLHARLDELLEHHRVSLARLLDQLDQPRSVVDVFSALFKRAVSPETIGMATGEAIAHLNYLVSSNNAIRKRDPTGVWRWHRVFPSSRSK